MMMVPPVFSTLALDWESFIGLAVILLIAFGSAVGNWLKKQSEKREAARRRELALMSPYQQDSDASRKGASGAGAVDSGSRREQLRELARQRAQMRAPGGSASSGFPAAGGAGSSQPRNLTMAERIARARAQEQYAERAKDLQAQAERAREQARQRVAQQRGLREQQALRQQQAAREQAQRQAAARQRAARQQPQRQQQQQRAHSSRSQQPTAARRKAPQPAASTSAPRPARRSQRVSPPPSPAAASDRRQPAASSQLGRPGRRQPPAAPRPAPVASSLLAGGVSQLSPQSLREAFVLKEILDRPVGLREPGAHGLL